MVGLGQFKTTISPLSALLAFFTLLIVSVTLLQKFGLPVGGDVMELAIFTTFGGIGLLALLGTVSLDPVRLILFFLFALAAVSSQLLGGQAFSVNSLLLAVALYSTFLLRFDVGPDFYRRCMAIFINIMLFVAALLVIQQVMQLLLGWRSWPNLDRIAPQKFLFPGYNYLQPVSYGSRFYKPNAFLFLEVSFVSQFVAMAFIIELVLFQRLLRLAFFGVVLVITFAGTGLLLLLLCGPFLLVKLPPRLLLSLLVLGLMGAAVAGSVGWYDQVHQRFGEFSAAGSSGYYRFNMPIQTVMHAAADPRSIFTGHGAGSTGSGENQDVQGFLLVPFAKIIYEYGFLTFFAFYAFLIYCLFSAAPSFQVALALFLFYNLGGGGFVVPVYVITTMSLGALLRVTPDAESEISAPLRPMTLERDQLRSPEAALRSPAQALTAQTG